MGIEWPNVGQPHDPLEFKRKSLPTVRSGSLVVEAATPVEEREKDIRKERIGESPLTPVPARL